MKTRLEELSEEIGRLAKLAEGARLVGDGYLRENTLQKIRRKALQISREVLVVCRNLNRTGQSGQTK